MAKVPGARKVLHVLVCMQACEKPHSARRPAQQTRTCCSPIAAAASLTNTGCRRSGHAHLLSAGLYSVPHFSHNGCARACLMGMRDGDDGTCLRCNTTLCVMEMGQQDTTSIRNNCYAWAHGRVGCCQHPGQRDPFPMCPRVAHARNTQHAPLAVADSIWPIIGITCRSLCW